MDGLALAALGLVAAGLGLAAAGLAGPVACTWPSLTSASLVLRVQRLADRVPGRHRRVAGGVALMLILMAAGVMAYAAYPAAPARLAVMARAAEAGLRSALWVAPEAAPFAKAAAPPASAQPEAAVIVSPVPKLVNRPGAFDDATIQRYLDIGRDQGLTVRVTPLDPEDAPMRRYRAYEIALRLEANRRRDAAGTGAALGNGPYRMTVAEQETLLGSIAWNDYLDLRYRLNTASSIQQAELLTRNPPGGPSSFYVPPGGDFDAAGKAAGVENFSGAWAPHYDDQGGATWSRASSLAEAAQLDAGIKLVGPIPF